MGTKFYAVQMMIDGFGHDTATIICYPTKKECKNWIKCNKEQWDKFYGYETNMKIIEQEFGTEFNEYWG